MMITWTIKIIVENWKLTYCKGVKGVKGGKAIKAKAQRGQAVRASFWAFILGLLFKVF